MDGATRYNNGYYRDSLEKGLEYQDYVCKLLLSELAIPLSVMSSRKYQLSVGENLQGIEIKFDDKLKQTGNIYIEISEKSHPDKYSIKTITK